MIRSMNPANPCLRLACRHRLLMQSAVCAFLIFNACMSEAAHIVVRLKDMATVVSREVYLRDIALVTGDNEAEVTAANNLIIATIEEPATIVEPATESVEVTADFIRIRLVLRGFAYEDIEFKGSTAAGVKYVEPHQVSDMDVEQAAAEMLAVAMNVPVEDLQVSLAIPFMLQIPGNVREHDGLRVEVLRPSDVSPGQKNMTVRLWSNDDLVMARPARFNVLRRYRIAVTRVSLTRDQPIEDGQIQLENRFLDKEADEISPEVLQGRVARNNIAVGEIVKLANLSVPKSNVPETVVIKRRDSVPVIARIGGIEIRMRAAEALQEGRVGDFIQLKNIETQKTFSGRIHPLGYIEVR